MKSPPSFCRRPETIPERRVDFPEAGSRQKILVPGGRPLRPSQSSESSWSRADAKTAPTAVNAAPSRLLGILTTAIRRPSRAACARIHWPSQTSQSDHGGIEVGSPSARKLRSSRLSAPRTSSISMDTARSLPELPSCQSRIPVLTSWKQAPRVDHFERGDAGMTIHKGAIDWTNISGHFATGSSCAPWRNSGDATRKAASDR